MKEQKILITGANGQLGTALAKALRGKYGTESVITSDLTSKDKNAGPHEILDATDGPLMTVLVKKYGITQIYHLAAVLSAKGEENPIKTWNVNLNSLLTVLQISCKNGIKKVFFPSSVAVYGNDIDKWETPQGVALNPTTVYGMTKVAGENWAQYYFLKHGLDVRSLRYPGVIGHDSLPGGGTTDYAVDIYHKALQSQSFFCYLKKDTTLPMIYMDDAIRATLELMAAPKDAISIRTSYNLQAISFSPNEIAASIKKHFPDFKIAYTPDFRQKIAETWPCSLDDNSARDDWGWSPKFQLEDMTSDMIAQLSKKYPKKGSKS